MDVLSLYRQALLTGTKIDHVDNHYIFGSYRFHESTKTCFKRTLVGAVVDYYYTLRDVIFFLENAEQSVADYRRETVKQRLTAVVEADKASLKGYVTGSIETCPQLDLAAASAASYTAAAAQVAEASAPAGPQISAEELQEQRQRHAALFDESIKAPTQATSGANIEGVSSDKLEELRMLRRTQKRKSVAVDGGLEGLDPAYIQMDRKYLESMRVDEQAAATRATVLCKPGTDFSFAIKLFNDHILKVEVEKAKTAANAADKGQSKSSTGATSSTSAAAGAPAAKKLRPEDARTTPVSAASTRPGSSSAAAGAATDLRKPIIIVPSTLSGLISSINAADFLEGGKYISIEEKRKAGAQREKERYITRTMSNGVRAAYKLVDAPKFDAKDWDRVVGVFVLGQAWQFKDWPEKYSKPVELFNRVLGVHLTMDDRAVDSNVLSWNCKVLKINQFKRHLDAGAVNEFWAYLDEFMRLRKPALYNGLLAGGDRPPTSSSSSSSRPSSQSKDSNQHRPHHSNGGAK